MTADVRTMYLGLDLKSPLVASASPLTGNLAKLEALQRAGAGAVVLPSLFEEQLEHEEAEVVRLLEFGAESFPEARTYFPELERYNTGPEEYLELIRLARENLDIPVIASFNGCTPGGWLRYARMFQEAGASALELNAFLVPTDPKVSGEQVERRYMEVVQSIREAVDLPLAVKLGPYFSSLPHFAGRLEALGADGLVLFNRFQEPDILLETLQVVPRLVLSHPEEMGLPLRWIAILRDQVKLSLAATSGIHDAETAAKLVLAGADVLMVASCLLLKGPEYLETILHGLRFWLEEHEFDSLETAKGSMSRRNCPNPEGLDRANYMKALVSYSGRPL